MDGGGGVAGAAPVATESVRDRRVECMPVHKALLLRVCFSILFYICYSLLHEVDLRGRRPQGAAPGYAAATMWA